MVRSIAATIKYVAGRAADNVNIGEGMCLYNVRTAYQIPAAGDVDKDGDADAVDGILTTSRLYRDPRFAHERRGGFVWWRNARRPGHGHVAIPTGDGMCWSPGSPDYPSRWHKISIDDLGRRWGLELAGWSPDFNGVTVWTPPPAPPTPDTRGKNVDHALSDLERAERANVKRPERLAPIRAALKLLRGMRRP